MGGMTGLRAVALLVASVARAQVPSPIGRLLTYDYVVLEQDRAVCNDGTKAGYYFRPGANESRTFLIFLGGGNWCFNKADCMLRCPPSYVEDAWIGCALCTSKYFPAEQPLGGVFAPMNEDSILGKAHKAFVMYCSSDAFMGDGASFGLQFRGARIIEAVVHNFVNKYGLGQQPGDVVIFGGVSAGARGAMVNLDYIRDYMRSSGNATYVDEARVVGLLDSPLWLDTPPMPKSGFNGFRHSCRQVMDLANVTKLGRTCPTHFTENQRFKCLMGEYRVKYLEESFFLISAMYDSFQLMLNLGNITSDEEEGEFVATFGARMRDYMQEVPKSWANTYARENGGPNPNVRMRSYMPSCVSHARLMMEEGFSLEFAGQERVTPEQAFDSYLKELLRGGPPSNPISLIKDECTDPNCGAGCPVDPAMMMGAASSPRAGVAVAAVLLALARAAAMRP